jgi:hypothetical protein
MMLMMRKMMIIKSRRRGRRRIRTIGMREAVHILTNIRLFPRRMNLTTRVSYLIIHPRTRPLQL